MGDTDWLIFALLYVFSAAIAFTIIRKIANKPKSVRNV